MSSPSLLFFTYADRKYDFFAVPYAFFALVSNPTALVEIILEDYESFHAKQKDAIRILDNLFPNQVLFRQSSIVRSKPIIPNTVRFVEPAQLKAEYLYIGDIDLLVFENVLNRHLGLMKQYNLPFSNIIRKNSNITQLSGLHFVKYTDYYPLPYLDDLDLAKENDEHVLYEIMHRRNIMVPEDFNIRPVCGIHMSLSRDPLARSTGPTHQGYYTDAKPNWSASQVDYQKLLEIIRSEVYGKISSFFDIQFKLLIVMAEAMIIKKTERIHKLASAYLLDKPMIIPNYPVWRRQDFIAERDVCIKNYDFKGAIALGCKALLIWPTEIDFWIKQAWLYKTVKEDKRFMSTIQYILDFEKGEAALKSPRYAYLFDYYQTIKKA